MDIKEANFCKESDFYFRNKQYLINVLLSKSLAINPGSQNKLKILSVGVGTGEELKLLNSYGDVFAIDINEKILTDANAFLCKELKICDICQVNYPASYFDLVVCFDVLEHIEDDQKAISEICRVLKSGGIFVFSVPAFQLLYSSHDKALEHKRRYVPSQIRMLLKDFRNIKFYFWNFTFFIPIAVMRLVKKRKKAELDWGCIPNFVQPLLKLVLRLELILIKYLSINVNLGLTLCGYCIKKDI